MDNENTHLFGPHGPGACQSQRDALNARVDEMIRLLINILEVGEPYVSGFTRPFWLCHLYLLRAELGCHTTQPREPNDFERFRQCLMSLAHQFKCINRLVNSKLIPSTPELAKAIRKACQALIHLQAAILDVPRLEKEQEHLFAWGASLLSAVSLLGQVFSSTSLYALRIWPEELDGASIGVVKRSDFPALSDGLSRKTLRDGTCADRLAPTGGVTKF